MKRITLGFVLGAACAVAVAQGTGPLKIAGSIDLSGPAGEVGKDVLIGVQFAVDTLNKNGGVLGRQVSLEYQDNGSNPQRAVTQATGLLQNGGVDLLLSPMSSGGTLAVEKTVVSKFKVPTCVATSAADEITMKDFQHAIYSVTPNSYMEVKAVAQQAAKGPYKRYAVIAPDYAGARASANRFKEFLKEANPNVEIVVEEYPKFGATDYTASINKLVAAKPDYIYSVLFSSDLLTFTKQASAVGFFKQVGVFETLYDWNTLKAIGDTAPAGTLGTQRAPVNYIAKASPQGQEYVTQFKAKTGHFPADWSTLGYDCVMVWAQAVTSAKSPAYDAVMNAIETIPFNSPRGTLRFAKYDHQADVPSFMGTVEGTSKEWGQPILNVTTVVPGASARPSEAVVLKSRQQ